jgi:hypothetical protein
LYRRRSARENETRAQTIEDSLYDLKAINPDAPDTSDKRTRADLLKIIREAQAEIAAGVVELGKGSALPMLLRFAINDM